MNNCNFAGRLGRDAELRTANGKPVCNFSLAVDDFRGGEKATLWVSCGLWGERAEKLTQYLTKGTAVAVSGRVGVRQYQGKDEMKAELTLQVNDVTLLGSRQGDAAQPAAGHDWKAAEAREKAAPAAAPTQVAADFDDSIPF